MYSNWIKEKIPITTLLLILVIAFFGFFIIEKSKVNIKHENYQKQVEAAILMKNSMEKIKKSRLEKNIAIKEELDPNRTGIIGDEITTITTTNGNLAAKRTATNPDFAALMVRYFKKINLKKGDVIAVGASGSFPSLIIATLSAAEVMELKPLLIYSFGASMYGANIPNFTFWHMLNDLEELLPYQPIAVSLGGENDQANYMLFEKSKPTLIKLAKKTNLPFIYEEQLAKSIESRMELYQKQAGDKEIKTFVNIGGASANFGSVVNASLSFPNGLVLNPPKTIPTSESRGLIYEYSARGLPIIHLLNIRDLALKNGIAIDPKPLPKAGEAGVYYRVKYNKIYISLLILLIILLIWRQRKKTAV